jgi:hypothetical protein
MRRMGGDLLNHTKFLEDSVAHYRDRYRQERHAQRTLDEELKKMVIERRFLVHDMKQLQMNLRRARQETVLYLAEAKEAKALARWLDFRYRGMVGRMSGEAAEPA